MKKNSQTRGKPLVTWREQWWWLGCFLIAIAVVLLIARRLYGF